MKALHVFHRIFHYLFVWDLIIAVALLAYSAFSVLGVYVSYYTELVNEEVVIFDPEVWGNEEWLAVFSNPYTFCLVALVLVALGVYHFAASHVFKAARDMVAKKAAEEACEECCCCEEPVSDLDNQVEEVMKWKNLYVEGIITEREFIDKRNEILRIAK